LAAAALLLALSLESTTAFDMDELSDTADLSDLREPAGVPSVVAKSDLSLVQEVAKQGAAATVKIWDKSFSQAAVGAAQVQLERVVDTLGRRHPELLGEAAM
jgi:hypothetical protein